MLVSVKFYKDVGASSVSRLLTELSRLLTENSSLLTENTSLLTENTSLLTENTSLLTENTSLLTKITSLLTENYNLMTTFSSKFQIRIYSYPLNLRPSVHVLKWITENRPAFSP
ncbi:MAG: hypothetical protein IJ190_01720 [Prevotella sp.]|nr:hypothetical protein [Prevotella sp.]